MFTDSASLKLVAGKGGNGAVAWRREKFVPKGGPAGGNGGRGGSIILKADSHALSLEGFRNKKHIWAENGHSGGSGNRHGRDGADLVLKVPIGTVIKESESQEIIFDFTDSQKEFVICRGGRGGKGNTHFKSSTNQAPSECTEGAFGGEKEVDLELKLIADIGLVGLPNAGKSTLLISLSNAKAKVAPYPFTTLYPNLGVLHFDNFNKAMIADIPGIIKDAHADRGLGIAFLKHIERTSLLVFVIDISGSEGRDPQEDFKVLFDELFAYNSEMVKKPRIVALNKMDIDGAEERCEEFKKCFPDEKAFPISALGLTGLEEFVFALKRYFQETASSLFSNRE